MVVIHRARGFRFVIYRSDHEPAHVHVIGAGQARINLLGPGGAPAVVWSAGINRGDLRRLIAETIELRGVFLQEWKRIHG